MEQVDYREQPSFGGRSDQVIVGTDREHPNPLGAMVGPQPDRKIMCYDLPSELASYDAMGDAGYQAGQPAGYPPTARAGGGDWDQDGDVYADHDGPRARPYDGSGY